MTALESCSSKRFLYKDIYLEEEISFLVFGNARLELGFDRAKGSWLAYTANGIAGNIISSLKPGITISLSGKEENICITGIEEMELVIQMNDAITGEAIEGMGKPLTLKLRPFQVLVGRL